MYVFIKTKLWKMDSTSCGYFGLISIKLRKRQNHLKIDI